MGNLQRHIWEGWTPQDFIDPHELGIVPTIRFASR